jgi:TPR repeat protein
MCRSGGMLVGMMGLMVMFALHGEDGLDSLRTKAKDGDVRAMLALGYKYRDGVGGAAKDERESVAWFRRAADLDAAEAYDNLGFMYCEGRGVPANLAIASGYFRASAEKGWNQGQYNLGMDYFYGRGVEDRKSVV